MSGRANTQFSVAVHVLTYLAGMGATPGGEHAISSDELSESANVNPVYIRRVLGPLREAGLLHSRPGASGGWQLARPAKRIRLDEVWDLVNGHEPVLATHGPAPECPVGRQLVDILGDIEADLAAAIRRQLHARTVAALIDEAVLAADLAQTRM